MGDDVSDNFLKDLIEDFYSSVTAHFYDDESKVSNNNKVYKGKTVFLDTLKELFRYVSKVDNELNTSFEGSVFKPVAIPLKVFARMRVEEFFYANLIINLFSNISNDENINEFGYTRQQVILVQNKWADLINKAKGVTSKQIEAKVDEIILRKEEYYEVSAEVRNMSLALKKFVNFFEEYASLKACEELLKKQREKFINENPLPIKK